MTAQSKQPKMEKSPQETWQEGRVSVFVRTTIITIISVAVFFALGYIVDKTLESSPIGVVVALAIGFPLTQYIVYKQTKKYSKTKFK